MVTTLLRDLAARVKGGVRSWMVPAHARRHALVGPAHLWEMKRDFQFAFLREQGLEPHHWLLDIGCGTLRGGIPLIRHLEPGHYYGLEVREEALAEARNELRDAGLEDRKPVLVRPEGDTPLDLGRPFDYVWAFSVLIHMSDDILEGTLDLVGRHLAPQGRFFANVKIGNAREGTWQGFPIVWRSEAFYAEAAGRHGMTVRELGPLRELGHVSGYPNQDEQRMLELAVRPKNQAEPGA